MIARYSLTCLVLAIAAASTPARAADERPNILWVTIEDASPAIASFGDTYAVTPNIDRLAQQGVRYRHAYAPTGVCAPARSSLILGMYASTAGTQHMRSQVRLPPTIKLFSRILKEAGYYTTNNVKQDYNLTTQASTYNPVAAAWDESSERAHWRNRPDNRQPFFAVFNFTTSHESQIRINPAEHEARMKTVSAKVPNARHDPALASVPPYHPDTPEVRRDWANFADMMTYTDMLVGDVLAQLEKDGLADSTIVFFYSDHGTGMPRSKRWLYDSSTRVPLVVRFPKKWQHWATGAPGTVSDRLVSFVDFGPTALSLAGIKSPPLMQGVPFLGPYAGPSRAYVHGFRDRMDERYDMLRSVRDNRYRYIRNYLPHRIYGQYLAYMFLMPTTRVWKQMYDSGKLVGPQRAFFEPKAPEELYDTWADPHEVHNLAKDSQHDLVRRRLSTELDRWILESRDTGFLAEGEMYRRAGEKTPHDLAQDQSQYDLPRILQAANRAGAQDPSNLRQLIADLRDRDGGVRYWAATGLVSLGRRAMAARAALLTALSDDCPDVRIAAAEALIGLGDTQRALEVLRTSLRDPGEFVRLHAVNVVDNVGNAARPILADIEIAAAVEPKDTYPKRLLPYLVDKLKR